MKTSERREDIIKILKSANSAVVAKDLATKYGVSRQVIVQDLAVIKAAVPGIIATNRGYILQSDKMCSREFKVRHDESEVIKELNLIVDCGGMVKNVSICHSVYGRVTAEMDIRSRQDVNEYMERIANSKSTMLGSATSGYHYHLVEAISEERLDLIQEKLDQEGFIVPLLPWEQEEN